MRDAKLRRVHEHDHDHASAQEQDGKNESGGNSDRMRGTFPGQAR